MWRTHIVSTLSFWLKPWSYIIHMSIWVIQLQIHQTKNLTISLKSIFKIFNKNLMVKFLKFLSKIRYVNKNITVAACCSRWKCSTYYKVTQFLGLVCPFIQITWSLIEIFWVFCRYIRCTLELRALLLSISYWTKLKIE